MYHQERDDSREEETNTAKQFSFFLSFSLSKKRKKFTSRYYYRWRWRFSPLHPSKVYTEVEKCWDLFSLMSCINMHTLDELFLLHPSHTHPHEWRCNSSDREELNECSFAGTQNGEGRIACIYLKAHPFAEREIKKKGEKKRKRETTSLINLPVYGASYFMKTQWNREGSKIKCNPGAK